MTADEDSDADNESEEDDDEENSENGKDKSRDDDINLNALLKGVGCMKAVEQKSNGANVGDVFSFLDKLLKLDTAQNAKPVAKQIDEQKRMRVLELRGNTLGIESGKRNADALKKHSKLEVLVMTFVWRCLWSDMFTGRLKNEIPPILKCLCLAMMSVKCHITELDLPDNAFGPIGAEQPWILFVCLGIQEFLVSPAAYSSEVLKLNDNGLGAGGKVVAQCLSQCHDNSVKVGRPLKLKTFIAGRNRLEVSGATLQHQHLRKLERLKIYSAEEKCDEESDDPGGIHAGLFDTLPLH